MVKAELEKMEYNNKELKELNEEMENYFRSTIIPQLFFDKNLILRKFSPAAMKQFNVNSSDIGKQLHVLSNNLDYSSLLKDINLTLSTHQLIEKEIQTTDKRWYRMNVLPYVERNGNVANGIILTFVDINNYVNTLEELQRVNSENELFIYTVTHDLKAPLHNIDGLIDTLKESIDTNNVEERDHILSMLKLSTVKMKEMISDLSKISKVDVKSLDNRVLNKFEDILDEVRLILKEKIDRSQAQIKTDFQVNDINISRKDIRSILYNLLSNAIKYRSKNRDLIISIKTQRVDGFILLSVQDNGRGIEENNKEVIFSQFGRAIKDVEGTGIGLYLVSRIVDSHGGKIIVNSRLNEGSEFLVYLKI